MKVYVVLTGNETDVDYHVVSVHRDKQNAIAKALQQPSPLDGYIWELEGSVENVWFGYHPELDSTFGYLDVSEFELED
jgi:hypothetical protein